MLLLRHLTQHKLHISLKIMIRSPFRILEGDFFVAQYKKSWGFPRWGEYGQNRDTVQVRLCDYHACEEKADHPAPKAPSSDDKWWFCQTHAAEYNKNWNFFEGMTTEEAKHYAQDEKRTGAGYAQANTYDWQGPSGEDGLSVVEREALELLDLDNDASSGEIKARYRVLAKQYHPDHNQGDSDAEIMFQKVRAAYEALKNRVEKQSFHG